MLLKSLIAVHRCQGLRQQKAKQCKKQICRCDVKIHSIINGQLYGIRLDCIFTVPTCPSLEKLLNSLQLFAGVCDAGGKSIIYDLEELRKKVQRIGTLAQTLYY